MEGPTTCLAKKKMELYPRYPMPFQRVETKFFNSEVMNHISKDITKKLTGVHPQKKNIIVSKENILSVMDSIYEQNPHVTMEQKVGMVISFIVDQIKTEFETIEKNNALDIEVIKYSGEYGIRRYPILKTREKHPLYGIFDIRY